MSQHFRKSKRKDPRDRFAAWATQNGAEILERKNYEFARFIAGGVLCIIHENKNQVVTAFNPREMRDAYDAWRSGRSYDLRSDPPEPEVEDWHAMGIALCAVATRAKAGEQIDIAAEADMLRIPVARLCRSMVAYGAPATTPGEAP